jgi:pimeloyl-ACP methyl ester carboxylesterase
VTVRYEFVSANGISLHTALAGPDDGDPVVLLHGFPEAWFGWKRQIGDLAASGFRVIVPDQRGYNLSDKPDGVSNYKMRYLVEDVLGLADALGHERFHLAGHDFGAMVGWNLALRHPQRLKRLAIANVPHPAIMRSYLRTHASQMLKSWYALFFQIPVLPEWFVRAFNWRFLASALPSYFTDEELKRYRTAWAVPGAITSMINWYRATLRPSRGDATPVKVKVPTLVLWGQQDPYLSYEMASLSVELCEGGRLVTFEDATHWVLFDKAEEVNQLLIEHFSSQ